MEYIIVDLDNCISDDAWRIPRINWDKEDPVERYHDYHLLSGFDEIHNTDIFQGERGIIIFTARPTTYAAVTQEWLRRKNVRYTFLVMRNKNDHRHSTELKETMLEWLPQICGVPLNKIVAAYDDRPDVVRMYQKYNIEAHVRCIHNVCAYTKPGGFA